MWDLSSSYIVRPGSYIFFRLVAKERGLLHSAQFISGQVEREAQFRFGETVEQFVQVWGNREGHGRKE